MNDKLLPMAWMFYMLMKYTLGTHRPDTYNSKMQQKNLYYL